MILFRLNRFGLWIISTQKLSLLVLRIKSSASRERGLIEHWYGLGTLHKIHPSRKLQKVKSVKVSPTNRRKIFVSRPNHVPIFIDWFFNVKCCNQAGHCNPYGWECHVPARTNPTWFGFSVSTDGPPSKSTDLPPSESPTCMCRVPHIFIQLPILYKTFGFKHERIGVYTFVV